MSRKIKVMIGVLVAVMLMTLGGTAIALADNTQPPATDNTSPKMAFFERIANILNIDTQTLINAFRQAGQEMQSDNQGRQQRMQEKKQELQERMQEKRQELQDKLKQKREQLQEQSREKLLDKAVEKGVITEPEKVQIEDWWNARPAAVDKLPKIGFGVPGLAKPQPGPTENRSANNAMPRFNMAKGAVR